MEYIQPSGQNIMTMADVATSEAAQLLIPRYDFFQKNPFTALETGVGDCRAVAMILVAMRPDLAFVRHVTKSTRGSAPAYVHYLALDRLNEIIIHSSGAPLTPEGAHIKAVHISDFAVGWDEVGERRAKPHFALTMLEKICEGSDDEHRKRSECTLSMKVEDPQDRLTVGTMSNLGEELVRRLPVV